jgi:membrane-bound ClpP family serine protease
VRRPDPPSLTAGLVLIALGAVLLLDRAGAIDVGFAVVAPVACAALGAILLVSGLTRDD